MCVLQAWSLDDVWRTRERNADTLGGCIGEQSLADAKIGAGTAAAGHDEEEENEGTATFHRSATPTPNAAQGARAPATRAGDAVVSISRMVTSSTEGIDLLSSNHRRAR
jgi:hypothetical protein